MEQAGDNQKQTVRRRAQKFANVLTKGNARTKAFRKYRTTPVFRRLKRSLRPIKNTIGYVRKSVVRQSTWDKFTILRQPVTSERFYKKMEKENTIIFYVDNRASKKDIRTAFQDRFDVTVERINTLHTPDGRKKAFIKLPKTVEATEVANKIGLI